MFNQEHEKADFKESSQKELSLVTAYDIKSKLNSSINKSKKNSKLHAVRHDSNSTNLNDIFHIKLHELRRNIKAHACTA